MTAGEHAEGLKADWQSLFGAQGASAGAGKIAVLSGDSMTSSASSRR